MGVEIAYTLHPIAPGNPGSTAFACDQVARVTPLSLAERPFAPPEGGWDYLYDVEADAPQALHVPATLTPGNLDGSWIRASIDSWDGSGIGAGAAGGVQVDAVSAPARAART